MSRKVQREKNLREVSLLILKAEIRDSKIKETAKIKVGNTLIRDLKTAKTKELFLQIRVIKNEGL